MIKTHPSLLSLCLSLSLLLAAFLIWGASNPAFAQQKPEAPKISINCQDEDLTVVLQDIARQAGREIYIPEALSGRRVTLNFSDVSTNQALKQAMAGIKDFMPLDISDKIQILPVAARSSQAESDEMNKIGNTGVYRSMESTTVTNP